MQLNVELHDPLYIQDMVVRWRQLRKFRDTSWTMEPMQGGWMSPNMVNAVVAAGCEWFLRRTGETCAPCPFSR